MYFNDLKIETAVHQYFLLAEKKDFFTAESNSLEFIRSGHILLYRKRDNRIADLYAGALFWMREGDSYLFAPAPGNQSPSGKYTEHLYLDFTGPRSERMVDSLETLYPQGVFHPSCPEEISNIFFRILQLYRIDPEARLPEITLKLEELMFTVCHSPSISGRGKKDAYGLDQIAETLRSEPFREYDFHKTAKDLSLSMDHFRRLFRARHKLTPQEYLNYQRMLRAAELLEKTDLRIKEIVYSCHFKSDMDFSRNFKKYSGLSPRNYRKKYRP